MARTIYGEARGEPIAGQEAVAHVIVNRLHDGHFGTTIAQICLEPWQFSCWTTSKSNLANLRAMISVSNNDIHLNELRDLADAVIAGNDDPTSGSQFYYADGTPMPSWASAFVFTVQIGHHRFYRQERT